MVVGIRLFGVLRKYGRDGGVVIGVEIPEHSRAGEIRRILKDRLAEDFPGENAHSLVERSALVDAVRVLADDDELTMPVELMLLPPVCGG